jgi:hypothetical protein
MACSDTFSAPLEGAVQGMLELRRGGTNFAVRAAAIRDLLCRASFAGPAPKAWTEDGRVVVEYPRFWLAGLLHHGSQRAEIVLNAELPWSLAITGALGDSTLDLEAVSLNSLRIDRGAGRVQVKLPRPRGRVGIRVGGGASDVTFLLPSGVPAVLHIAGGASRIEFAGERYATVGGPTRFETPGAGSQHDRYEIEIVGGATRLTISEQEAVP